MNYLQLVVLAMALAAPAVEAASKKTCVPKGADKTTACKSLSKGGLVNLNLLGCSSTDISPDISALRRDAHLRRRHANATRQAAATTTELCNSLSEAGLINLSALGCSATNVSPSIDVLKRRHEKRDALCETLSQAGLANVALLGCSQTEVSPTVDILRKRNDLCARMASHGLHARDLGCEGLVARANAVDDELRDAQCNDLSQAGLINLSLFGCSEKALLELNDLTRRQTCSCPPTSGGSNPPSGGSNPPSGGGSNPPSGGGSNPPSGGGSNPPSGGGSNPPSGGGSNPPSGGGSNPPSGGGSNPPSGGGSNPPSGGGSNPPSGGGNTPECVPPKDGGNGGANTPSGGDDNDDCDQTSEQVCNTLSKAGLVSLDILGCSQIKVDPTIKIGQSLLGSDTKGSSLGSLFGGI